MKNKVITKIALICLLIVMLCSVTAVAFAEGAPSKEVNRVNIMHITDIHYIPIDYCYTGDKKDNDFKTKIQGDPKLMLESSAVLESTLKMVKKANPDYLLVTGDITSNGEKQSLIDAANALRKLQNEIRKEGKKDFQVLVVPGNHDVFNNRHAANYSSGIKEEAESASRLEFAKIFSSLGYPDLSNEEAKAFYKENEWVVGGRHLPYQTEGDVAFINSTTNEKLKFEYFADLNNSELVDGLGGLTYICYDDENKLSFAGFDTNLSVKGNQRTEGEYNKANIDWYCARDLSNYTQISLAHHNMIKHFSKQEQFVPKFITYGWEEVAERLVSNGVRYSYTGHFHSSDMAKYVALSNDNLMYEIETAATISYGAAVRETAIIDYEDGTQNFESELTPVEEADFTYLVENNLFLDDYKNCLDKNNICDIQKYIEKKLFNPWLVNIIDSFITPQKLGPIIDSIKPMYGVDVSKLINKLISEINTKVLTDYTYSGDNERLKGDENKLYAYLNELVLKGINVDVAFGKNLNDLLLYVYGQNLMGGEVQKEKELPLWVKDAFKKFRSGSGAEDVFQVLLYEDNGLYNLVRDLAEKEIDLSEFPIIKTALSLIGISDVDLSKVVLNDLVPTLLTNLKEEKGIDLGLTGSNLIENVDILIDKYLNDSFYKGFGRVLIELASSFSVDDTFDGEFDKVITYKYNDKDKKSFSKNGKVKVIPTEDNGRLPSEITVTFGPNPQTDKNIVWTTSQYLPVGDLQYKVMDTEEWTTVKANSAIIPYSDTMFDFGFITTTIDKNICRHNVRLTGLKPNTKYYFRVGNQEKEIWTEIGVFTTASDKDEAFEVALYSELQQMDKLSYEESLDKLIESVKMFNKKSPAFVVSLGDLVDNGLNANQWREALNTLHPFTRSLTQLVVPGSQDNKEYISNDKGKNTSSNVNIEDMTYKMLNMHFDLNGADFKTQKNYFSFDYSAVHFIVLDTNDIVENKLSSKQENWLKEDLQNSQKPFKVVLMHKGIFSPGEHVKAQEIVGMREQLAPIFYANKVNIVFSGYEHIYAETKLLDAEGKEAEDGVLYVTIGAMGDKGKKYVEDVDFPIAFGPELHYPNLETNTFMKLAFDGEELTYQGYAFKDFYFVKVQDYKALRLLGLWIGLGVLAVIAISGTIIGVMVINKNKRKISKARAMAIEENMIDEPIDFEDKK